MDTDLFIALRKYPCTDDNETVVTVAEFLEKRMEAIDKTRKPLTEEQIKQGILEADPAGEDLCIWSFMAGIAFAEKAHGIGGE